MGEKLNFKNIRKLNNVPMRVYSTNNTRCCSRTFLCEKHGTGCVPESAPA